MFGYTVRSTQYGNVTVERRGPSGALALWAYVPARDCGHGSGPYMGYTVKQAICLFRAELRATYGRDWWRWPR